MSGSVVDNLAIHYEIERIRELRQSFDRRIFSFRLISAAERVRT